MLFVDFPGDVCGFVDFLESLIMQMSDASKSPSSQKCVFRLVTTV